MLGDISAIDTTLSTVVRDGPWVCSAEIVASISFCRWRRRRPLPAAGSTAPAGAGLSSGSAAISLRSPPPSALPQGEGEILVRVALREPPPLAQGYRI